MNHELGIFYESWTMVTGRGQTLPKINCRVFYTGVSYQCTTIMMFQFGHDTVIGNQVTVIVQPNVFSILLKISDKSVNVFAN